MQLPTNQRKRAGQALVEFALTVTLLFFLLTATIDFGLAFFAYQGIAGAAQEGVSYAAFKPLAASGNTPVVNDVEIRQRVRNEAGVNGNAPNRARFVNLFNLNTDSSDDSAEVQAEYIKITAVANNANVGFTTCGAAASERKTNYCDMVVEVVYDYRPFFAARGLLGLNKITLHAKRQMTISR